jgi:hypothetical protein
LKLAIVKGTTSKLLQVFIQDSSSTSGAGLTGLAHNTASLSAYYYREGAASAVAITLATMTLGTWATGGFIVVDGTNMPGGYQLGIPDAALASGANSVIVMLKGAANMAPLLLEIQLTDVNLHDAVRGGMTALPNAAAEAAGGLFTRGTGAGQINQAANGMIDTNPVRLNNVSQSLLDLKDFADDGYDPSTNKVQGVVLTDTLTTYTGNTLQTGDAFARIGANGSGLTAVPWNSAWDPEVQSEAADALVAYDPPTQAELTTATANLDAAVSSRSSHSAADVWAVATRALTDKAGFSLSAAGVQAIWDALTAALTTANSIGKKLADWALGSDNRVLVSANAHTSGETVAAVTGAVGSVTGGVGGNVTGSVGSLAAQAKADVNAEMLDVMNVDTHAEPAGVPAATATLVAKINWITALCRNKITQTATTQTLRNDADSAAVATASVADDGTTFTRGEWS